MALYRLASLVVLLSLWCTGWPVVRLLSSSENFLIEVETSTGWAKRASGPGLYGFDEVYGLAFDPGTGTLYGSNTDFNELVKIDPQTGTPTSIGAVGFDDVEGLAFDPGTSTLYGSDASTDQLITIDTQTGAGTAVGPTGYFDAYALTVTM